MLVATYMTRDPVTASPHDLLSDVQRRMRSGGFRRMPVLDGGRLVGILSDRDLGPHSGHLAETRVTAAMTENVLTVTGATPLRVAAQKMLDYKIDGLPVVDEGRLVGIVTTGDILTAFVESRAFESR